MESNSKLSEARSNLIRSILEAGKRAFDPSQNPDERAVARNDFENIIKRRVARPFARHKSSTDSGASAPEHGISFRR